MPLSDLPTAPSPTPGRYLADADGTAYYRAALTQTDGDLAVVCPTQWLHQKLGSLGVSARCAPQTCLITAQPKR